MPHPGTGTLKNKIFKDPLLISFLRTAIFSPSTMVLDPYLFDEFSAQLFFWHVPFPTFVYAEQVFLTASSPPFSSSKKRGEKATIFLLLLHSVLLLIKRAHPRDLLICSSLLEASLLPSFLLISCLVFYFCSLSFPQYSYINCPLFSSSHLCPPLKISQSSCWESDR